jgi:hypothetical protein
MTSEKLKSQKNANAQNQTLKHSKSNAKDQISKSQNLKIKAQKIKIKTTQTWRGNREPQIHHCLARSNRNNLVAAGCDS